MRKLLITLAMLMAFTAIHAQKISYIEATTSWYHVYDDNGKKVHTFSTTQGEVVAYSESFYIVKHGSWYYAFNAKGKKLYTFAVSNVGEVLHATGDTFTSKRGQWVYTWDKNGKKLRTRYANH